MLGTKGNGFFGDFNVGAVAPKLYASFYDTTTQTVAQNTPQALQVNTINLNYGFTVGNNAQGKPTRITPTVGGSFNLQFSAQLQRTSGGSVATVNFWLRKKESNISYTNTFINLQGNAGDLVAAWNFFVALSVTDYIEIMWQQDDNVAIPYLAAGATYPETPSVIITINQL
jgi:hypothetical protein